MTDRPSQKEYWGGKAGDEWAAHADQLDIMLAGVAEAALKRAAFKPGERVLDIGCGAGATSLEIARRVAPGAVVGVDISPQLLSVARSRAGGRAEFLEADAAAISFASKFDAAFSRFGIMFFDAPAPAFANIRAQLRAGGRIVFACWRTFGENIWATTPVEAVVPMLKSPLAPPDPDAPGPFAFADADKIRRILTESGWRNIDIARWDDDIAIGGGVSLPETADFLLRVGPCARAIADQGLDEAEARRRLIERLSPLYKNGAVALPAACWIVSASA